MDITQKVEKHIEHHRRMVDSYTPSHDRRRKTLARRASDQDQPTLRVRVSDQYRPTLTPRMGLWMAVFLILYLISLVWLGKYLVNLL